MFVLVVDLGRRDLQTTTSSEVESTSWPRKDRRGLTQVAVHFRLRRRGTTGFDGGTT